MVALPGVDPSWSAYLDVPSTSAADAAGTVHRWHYLDNGVGNDGGQVRGTLLCVHGNPTWSYLWRTFLRAGTEAGWRVIAVDQLDMGYSERTGVFRRLADRITDLEDFVAAASITGPVITVGHDWGGVVSLGYANRNRRDLAGVILTNTAIHQDPASRIPAPLRLALAPGVHGLGTRTTSAFLDVTLALGRPTLAPDVRRAFRAPYRTPSDRQGIANFVSDIPADATHPSHAALARTAEGIRSLDVPVLMMWGPKDPIFSDPYLEDLARRLPHADIHRFEGASHLVQEDADTASTAMEWLADRFVGSGDALRAAGTATTTAAGATAAGEAAPHAPLGQRLTELASGPDGSRTAVAEMTSGGPPRVLSWRQLDDDVAAVATGLLALGYGSGTRVSLLVPPGVDLTVLIYACLRIGAVIVVADAGLGARGLDRAVRGSAPDVVIGIERALIAARAFGWPGRRISAGPLTATKQRILRVEASLNDLRAAHPTAHTPVADVGADADAAILFTSGSTGPAKGVVYTHRQLSAMRDAVGRTLGLGPGTALVAGFAPFALLGPALGATSVTPAMDVTAPRTLSARALADAAAAIDATVVFASPAALRNVLATSPDLDANGRRALGRITLLLSAGAPIPVPLLEAVQDLVPAATLHTPYGMTESLLVADIDLGGIRAAAASDADGAGNGVCVGLPVHGARAAVSPLDQIGAATGDPTVTPGVTGEILVDAPHVKDRYFRLWRTQQDAARTGPWHRTGDVGHFDAEGRLWVEGRLGHVITSATGVLTPVGLEQALETIDGVRLAAVVGVGPAGTQAVVAVLETDGAGRRPRLADATPAATARAAAHVHGVDLAAVIVVPALPVDVRHNAKIDRGRIAAWSGSFLSGGRAGSL